MSDHSHDNVKSASGGSGEFASIVSAYLDNQLSEAAAECLLAELKTDASKRRIFVAVAMQARMIREIASERLSEEQEGLSLTMPRRSEKDESERYPHVPDDRRSVLMDALDKEREARLRGQASAALEKEKQESAERLRQESIRRLYGLSKPQHQSTTKHYVIPRPLFYGSIAAAIAIAVVLIAPLFDQGNDGQTQIAEDHTDLQQKPEVVPVPPPIVASLYADAGAEWAEGTPTPNKENQLASQSYRLDSGYVELDFEQGARVVIEGPAEFDLLSAHRMRLLSGRVTGLVNKGAEGFTVLTPHATLIDLGTEFGVDVGTERGTDLHVFDGKVSIAGAAESGYASRQQVIGHGEARRADIRTNKIVAIDVRQDEFLRSGDVEQLAKVDEKRRKRMAWLMKLRHDPALVAFFDFENKDELIVNTVRRVGGDQVMPRDARWTRQAAYSDTQALQLNGKAVELGTDVGDAIGKTQAVSVSFWAKWDANAPIWMGVFQLGIASDGRSELVVDVHNTVMWTTGIPGNTEVNASGIVGRPYSQVEQASFRNNQYRHFTMVYDGSKAQASGRIYIDGVLGGTFDGKGELDFTGAELRIGHFVHPEFADVKQFVGEIDDLMIWTRALSEQEISDLAKTE